MTDDDPEPDDRDPPDDPADVRAGPGGLHVLDPDEIDDDGEGVDDRQTVLITGAAGNIGRKLSAAWDDVYDLIRLDREPDPDDPGLIAADLADPAADWGELFHGVDAVVHLAADPDELADWEALVGPNIDALFNVFHAAALAGVERLVFASSNHANGGYRDQGDGPIGVDLPPKPDGPYGATKLMGERLGRCLSETFELTFVALRLGWVQRGGNRPETLPDDWSRGLWLSDADMVRLFGLAVEADLGDRTCVVVNGMSRNRGTRWDLEPAAGLLGFEPEDDAFADS